MKITKILCVVLFFLCGLSDSKKFERCQLVRELIKTKQLQKSFLGCWVCLIEKASNRNTSAFVVTPSGKKFYGLYKIPSVWCREKKRGGACNIKCEDLLNEDIRDDTACAVKIFQEMGFQYWPDWLQKCKNNDFITNEIYKCPDLRFSPDRSASRSSSRSKRSPKEDLFTRLKRSLGLKVKNDVCYGKCCS
ncbi:lysozyme-like isoform X2 [Anticarsia gemmatalis]|uniref:lysozyme-like isoform X2 n=1 Tax=Anticarsia gemmatalis TaxID=129554 RepID=UPI003F76395F